MVATYEINIRKKGLQQAQVEKMVNELKARLGGEASVTFGKHEPAESRSDRLSQALSELESAVEQTKSEVEELRDEMQNWLDGLEGANMENVPKHDEVQEALDALEEMLSGLEDIEVPDAGGVSFPGMY